MGGVPVDRGWAWVVAAGCAVNIMFSMGTVRNVGFLFVAAEETFGSSSTTTSLMIILINISYVVTTILLLGLNNRLSNRWITLIGGLVSSLGIMLSGFAPNIYVYAAILGPCVGVGVVLRSVPVVVMLSVYFKEKLSLATAVTFTGTSFGQIIFPHFLNYLLREFDYRGAMIIFGAFNLHSIIGSMVFRPASFYQTREKRPQTVRKVVKDDEPGQSVGYNDIGGSNTHSSRSGGSEIPIEIIVTSVHISDTKDNTRQTVGDVSLGADNKAYIVSEVHGEEKSPESVIHLTINPESQTAEQPTVSIAQQSSNTTVQTDSNTQLTSNTAVQTGSNALTSTITVQPSVLADLKTLFTSPVFYLFTISKVLNLVEVFSLFTFMIPYGASVGFDESQLAFTWMVSGLVDLPSRLFHGWITSFDAVNPTIYTCVMLSVGSVIRVVCVLIPRYETLFVQGLVLGLLYSCLLPMTNIMAIESIGIRLFDKCLLVAKLTQMFGMILVPLFFGGFYDTFGSYVVPSLTCAAINICGVVITLVEVILRKLGKIKPPQ